MLIGAVVEYSFGIGYAMREHEGHFAEVIGYLESNMPIEGPSGYPVSTWELGAVPYSLVRDHPALMLGFMKLVEAAASAALVRIVEVLERKGETVLAAGTVKKD